VRVCGRYNLIPEEGAWADVGAILGEEILALLLAMEPRYNISPTQTIPIIVMGQERKPILIESRWGFISSNWDKPYPPANTTNVRSETAPRKPMWRQAWRHQRCLIPASGWYEWFVLEDDSTKPPKVPHHIRQQDGKHILFAGVWSIYRSHPEATGIPTSAIATIASPPSIARIHARTPVVLQPEFWRDWIDPDITEIERIGDMVQRGAARLFSMQTLGPEVGNSRNQGAELVDSRPRPEADQADLVVDDPVLAWLNLTPADELRRAIADRLAETPLPTAAERRLWYRQIEDRDDAEALASLMKLIKASLRKPKTAQASKPPPSEPSQTDLF
jgi:putative SOS response-associated peptidase YedK